MQLRLGTVGFALDVAQRNAQFADAALQTGGAPRRRQQVDAVVGVLIELVLPLQRGGLIGQYAHFLVQCGDLMAQLRHGGVVRAASEQHGGGEQGDFGITGCHDGDFLC